MRSLQGTASCRRARLSDLRGRVQGFRAGGCSGAEDRLHGSHGCTARDRHPATELLEQIPCDEVAGSPGSARCPGHAGRVGAGASRFGGSGCACSGRSLRAMIDEAKIDLQSGLDMRQRPRKEHAFTLMYGRKLISRADLGAYKQRTRPNGEKPKAGHAKSPKQTWHKVVLLGSRQEFLH